MSVQPASIGKYRILDRIGAGAMGEVFRARDEALGRVVALKTIVERAQDTLHDERVARFRREAQAAAGLSHPSIVTVFDFGEVDGRLFLAMELLEGEDLADALARGRAGGLDQRLDLLHQVCTAVGFAHARGIVHRDLKPANIRLLPGGAVKIMDFGLARLEGSKATLAGQVLGTPHYMSPEQVRAETADARSDVFALGAIAFELLGGRKPFPAPGAHAALFQVLEREPEPLHELNPALPEVADTVVRRALAKHAVERYADATQMAEVVAALREHIAGRAPASAILERVRAADGNHGTGGAASWPRASASLAQALSAIDTAPVAETSGVPPALVVFQGESGVDRQLQASPGSLLLDLSLQAGIPHFHECGMRARCSTCRVRVAAGGAGLTPRTPEETRLAERLGWPGEVRLACQARVIGPVVVRRLVLDEEDLGLLVAERREPSATKELAVAVMAAGLLDLAPLRKLTPYDTVHVLNRFYSFVADPVVTSGGVVNAYTPDGLSALFGLDGGEAREKCVGAVRAALRMCARMDEFAGWVREHFGANLQFGVGLHFGRMVVGRIGHPSRMEIRAVGGAPALAERLRLQNRGRATRVLATEELVNVVESDVRLGLAVQEEDTLDGRVTTIHEVVELQKRDAVQIVQDTFEIVARRRQEAAALFYELLFQVDPSTKPLFATTDMARQGEMLMSVLSTAVRGLDRFDDLRTTLRDLGRRHVGYGVELQHYDSVGAALLEMVRRLTGQEFTPDVRLAWARIYGELTAEMLAGSQTSAA